MHGRRWSATLATLAALGMAMATAVAVALLPAGSVQAAPRAQAGCQFVLGFAALRGLIGAPTVGTCREHEHFNPSNGNAEQQTTGGLLVWRKADNWTAFTDGHRTWVNGPRGLQQRFNSERFRWESDAAGLPDPTPLLAWYYPQFSANTERDFRDAAAAQIDALIVSETGMTDLAPFLAAAQAARIRVVLGLEPTRHPSADAVAQRLAAVLGTLGGHPAYLRYQDKPVVAFWNLPGVPRLAGQTAEQTWATIRSRVDPGRSSVWIGEGPVAAALGSLPAFDALHLYSISWAADPVTTLRDSANRLRSSAPTTLWVATVMPGGAYGSGSDPALWQHRDRQNGAYYRAAWSGAIATNPAMVIVTSFNETVERTEIHPNGQWGMLYLDLTKELSTRWRG